MLTDSFKELSLIFSENSHRYKVLGVYYENRGKQPVKMASLKCNKHNHFFSQRFQSAKVLRFSKKCPGCSSEIQTKNRQLSISELKKRIEDSNNLLIKENYFIVDFLRNEKGNILQDNFNNNLVQLRCNLLGHTAPFIQSSTNVGEQMGCPECLKKRKPRRSAADYSNQLTKLLEIYNLNDVFEYNDKIDRDNNGKIKFNFKCKNCEAPLWAYKQHIVSLKCPKCNRKESIGEFKIQNFLLKNKYHFQSEKRFKDLKQKLPLPFEFYIPKLRLLIEFDGEQHYKPIKHLGGNKKFLKTAKNDLKKNAYCKAKKISLLRIPFYQLKEIEKIILSFIEKMNPGKAKFTLNYTPYIVQKRRKFNLKKLNNK